MAWRFRIEATCDSCHKSIIPESLNLNDLNTISSVTTARGCIQREWEKLGVMQGLPNMAGKRKMWCRECAGN